MPIYRPPREVSAQGRLLTSKRYTLSLASSRASFFSVSTFSLCYQRFILVSIIIRLFTLEYTHTHLSGSNGVCLYGRVCFLAFLHRFDVLNLSLELYANAHAHSPPLSHAHPHTHTHTPNGMELEGEGNERMSNLGTFVQ